MRRLGKLEDRGFGYLENRGSYSMEKKKDFETF